MRLPGSETGRSACLWIAPGVKLAIALGLILATALLPRRPHASYFVPAAVLAVFWLASRMPVGYALRRMIWAEFFIVGIGLLSLVAPAARPIFLATLLKSNLSVFAMVLLTWTTPFQDLLRELRRLRLPTVIVTTLALMYRYLPVLADESARMQRARASRTFSAQKRIAWKNLAMIIAQLFVRSADRAERIYLAMCARGWK
jgi:cobalt/nickel transport system permease protein